MSIWFQSTKQRKGWSNCKHEPKQMIFTQENMNKCERNVLRKFHCELVETIEPYELRPFLYSKGVLPNPTFLGRDRIRTRRAEKFLKYIAKRCPFSLFLESLSKDNAYDFLSVQLQQELESTAKDDSLTQHVPRELKETLFTPKRSEAVSFRHKLKRYSLSGNTTAFRRECKPIIDRWNTIPKTSIFLDNNQELADLYFMVLDAIIDRRRTLYDMTLCEDIEIFDKLLKVSLYTSSASLPAAMYLARYGSALLMAGRPVEEALSYVEQAKQRLQTLPGCIEYGTVLYIEYNMILSEIYEKNPTVQVKDRLVEIGKEAIGNFFREQETIGKDFRRMMLLKRSLLLLGIGPFMNNIDNIDISENDMKRSELIEMQKGAKYAHIGNSEKEIANIKQRVALLSENGNGFSIV